PARQGLKQTAPSLPVRQAGLAQHRLTIKHRMSNHAQFKPGNPWILGPWKSKLTNMLLVWVLFRRVRWPDKTAGGAMAMRVEARLPSRQALFCLDFSPPTGEAGLVRFFSSKEKK
ncbi:MAG: hypothetical protein KAQ79_15240, partial [Cyclobacteriaceae bacterium]|nr:hypothetical protein [Cyclobacteriaceae bacterium]